MAAVRAMNESGPNCLMMSVASASDPLPDSVRRTTSGKISGGNRVACDADVHEFLLEAARAGAAGTENRARTHSGSVAMLAIESTLRSP